jgi:hypothetical protein
VLAVIATDPAVKYYLNVLILKVRLERMLDRASGRMRK